MVTLHTERGRRRASTEAGMAIPEEFMLGLEATDDDAGPEQEAQLPAVQTLLT